MPWHTSPPVGVSSEKLIADGMSIPPFHGRCRCVLVMSEHSDTVPVFPNVKPDEVLSYNADTRIARMSLHGMSKTGLPYWKYDNCSRILPPCSKNYSIPRYDLSSCFTFSKSEHVSRGINL